MLKKLYLSFVSGLENISKPSTDFDLLERQSDIVTEVCKKQQKDIVSAVRTVVADQSKQNLHQNQRDLNVLQHNIVNDLNQKFDDLKTDKESDIQMITDHFDKSLEDRSAAWRNDLVPKKVQDQLDELHNQHLSEIQKLEKQIEDQRIKAEEVAKSKVDQQATTAESALQNIYDLNVGEKRQIDNKNRPPGSLFQKASGFISPRPPIGTTWNSRAIFGRTNPSPVATVLPQRQAAANDDVRSATNAVSLVPQQNSRVQQAEVPHIQPPRWAETPDHVVPATPESAREILEQSLTSVTDTDSLQATLEEENSQLLPVAQAQSKTTAKKAGPKKKGKKRKKRVFTKKPKAKLKTYEKHQRITKNQGNVVKSTQALAVYDFADETSPQPLIRKTSVMKQIVPLPNSDSRIIASSGLSR